MPLEDEAPRDKKGKNKPKPNQKEQQAEKGEHYYCACLQVCLLPCNCYWDLFMKLVMFFLR